MAFRGLVASHIVDNISDDHARNVRSPKVLQAVQVGEAIHIEDHQ